MNSYGVIFRVSIFGESHGPAIGINIDGCPPGIKLLPDNIEIIMDTIKAKNSIISI